MEQQESQKKSVQLTSEVSQKMTRTSSLWQPRLWGRMVHQGHGVPQTKLHSWVANWQLSSAQGYHTSWALTQTAYWLQIWLWVSIYSDLWGIFLWVPQSSFPTSKMCSSGNYFTDKEVFTVESMLISANLLGSVYAIAALAYSNVTLNSKIWNMNFAQKAGTGLRNMLKSNNWTTLGWNY